MADTPFGRYALLRKIASGGMAELFLARQLGPEGFEKLVAIKSILPERTNDANFVELFLREARLAARLSHPNIAQIYDLGKEGDTYFIAMEYISGENLGVVLARARELGETIPMRIACKIAMDVCEGLYYAHHLTDALGRPLRVIHCDISPQNILIGYDGSVKIVDFGIARAAAEPGNVGGEIRGKAGYMSPEQIACEVIDHSSDLFSLGVVLYELVAARRLFARQSPSETVRAVLETPVPPLHAFAPDVPVELEAVIRRLLERDRAKRYPDARAVQRELDLAAQKEGGVSTAAALSEWMGRLFQETLHKRVYVEKTLTAVIPITGVSLLGLPSVDEKENTPGESGSAGRWVKREIASRRLRVSLVLAGVCAAGAGAWAWLHRTDPKPAAVVMREPELTPRASPLPVEPPPKARVDEPAPEQVALQRRMETERPAMDEPSLMVPIRSRPRAPLRFGQVSLNTEPWTSVSVDGRKLGTTPLTQVRLPAGQHKVTLENPKLGIKVTLPLEVIADRLIQHRLLLRSSKRGWAVARHLKI